MIDKMQVNGQDLLVSQETLQIQAGYLNPTRIHLHRAPTDNDKSYMAIWEALGMHKELKYVHNHNLSGTYTCIVIAFNVVIYWFSCYCDDDVTFNDNMVIDNASNAINDHDEIQGIINLPFIKIERLEQDHDGSEEISNGTTSYWQVRL